MESSGSICTPSSRNAIAGRPTRVRMAFALTLALLIGGAGMLGSSTNAGATPWNSNVTLQGKAIACSSGASWVWVEGSNGERGWATRGTGRYSFHFKRVPAGGMTVRVNYGNNVCKKSTSFGLKRPAVGTTATRNVVSIY